MIGWVSVCWVGCGYGCFMGRVRVVVVCCVAAFLVVVGGVGLAADGVWSSPVDLSQSGKNALYPQVGLSSDGKIGRAHV